MTVAPSLFRTSEARKPVVSPPPDHCPLITVIEIAGAAFRLPAGSRATAVKEYVPLLRLVTLRA